MSKVLDICISDYSSYKNSVPKHILLLFFIFSIFSASLYPIPSSLPLCPPTHCQLWAIWQGRKEREWRGATEKKEAALVCLCLKKAVSKQIFSCILYVLQGFASFGVKMPVNQGESLWPNKISNMESCWSNGFVHFGPWCTYSREPLSILSTVIQPF